MKASVAPREEKGGRRRWARAAQLHSESGVGPEERAVSLGVHARPSMTSLQTPLVVRHEDEGYEDLASAKRRAAPAPGPEDIARRRRKAPWRAVLFAVGLLVLGCVLLVLGALMAAGIIRYLLSTAIALMVLGVLTFVPGTVVAA